MYSHPLSVYFQATEELGDELTCNSWGYVSGLTHAYFENDDLEAGEMLLRLLNNSNTSPIRQRRLLKSHKKLRNPGVIRELQSLVTTALTEEVEEMIDEYLPEYFKADEDGYDYS